MVTVEFEQESPVHDAEAEASRYTQDYNAMRLFDYSMTYHRSADFFNPMGIWQNYTDLVLQPSPVPFDEKIGMVINLASNCESHNGREAYVEELMKHIQVHSYGSCLNNMNGTGLSIPADGNVVDYMTKYKFYLAFENSCCEDYISEKFINGIWAGIVPVVAGPRDYSSYAPTNHSVINVLDFKSPKELAAYLNKVGNDKKLYDEYLEYKYNKVFSDQFNAIWKGRDLFGVYCEVAEELMHYKASSETQAATVVLPMIISSHCEEKNYLQKNFIDPYLNDITDVTLQDSSANMSNGRGDVTLAL